MKLYTLILLLPALLLAAHFETEDDSTSQQTTAEKKQYSLKEIFEYLNKQDYATVGKTSERMDSRAWTGKIPGTNRFRIPDEMLDKLKSEYKRLASPKAKEAMEDSLRRTPSRSKEPPLFIKRPYREADGSLSFGFAPESGDSDKVYPGGLGLDKDGTTKFLEDYWRRDK